MFPTSFRLYLLLLLLLLLHSTKYVVGQVLSRHIDSKTKKENAPTAPLSLSLSLRVCYLPCFISLFPFFYM